MPLRIQMHILRACIMNLVAQRPQPHHHFVTSSVWRQSLQSHRQHDILLLVARFSEMLQIVDSPSISCRWRWIWCLSFYMLESNSLWLGNEGFVAHRTFAANPPHWIVSVSSGVQLWSSCFSCFSICSSGWIYFQARCFYCHSSQ